MRFGVRSRLVVKRYITLLLAALPDRAASGDRLRTGGVAFSADEPPSDDGVFVSEPAFGRVLTRKTRESALGRRPPEPSPSPPEPGDVTLVLASLLLPLGSSAGTTDSEEPPPLTAELVEPVREALRLLPRNGTFMRWRK